MSGQLKRDQVVSCLGELIVVHSEVGSIATDVIAIIDTETSLAEDRKEERSRLAAIIREAEKYLSDGLVKVGTVFIFVTSNVINTKKKVDATGNPCTLTCENGGACVNSTGTAVCTCVNGYTGSSCETGELNRPLIFSKF